MRDRTGPETAAAALLAAVIAGCASRPTMNPSYPEARRATQVDEYHGVRIDDPYRWLEDPDSAETRAWVSAQNRVTRDWFDRGPDREAVERRLTELWNYARMSPPSRRGNRWFWTRNDGLQDQAVVWWSEGPGGEPRVLIDPNLLSADGSDSLADMRVSEDGSLLAYAVSSGGSDWVEWRVREVATGKDRPDRLRWVKFSSVAWLPDGSGFYYARYPEPAKGEELRAANRNQKLHFHRLGDAQEKDTLVYERPDEPEWGFGSEVTEDGRWLVIPAWVGTDARNRIFIDELATDEPVRGLLTAFDASYDFVGNDGPVFYFKTDAGAPRFRLVAVDVNDPERAEWREIVPEGPDTLAEARLVGNRFVLVWMHDVHHRITIHERDGQPVAEVPLPALGAVGQLVGRRSDADAYFSFTSFALPTAVHRYEVAAGRLTTHWTPDVKFDPSAYEAEQVWYASKDGTKIPMYVVHKKGIARDGSNPVLLYGYGGFNVPILPAFSVPTLVWLEMGGVYAQPALRGGSEYGEAWHQAAMRERKQNVFDDFIAAAERLIADGWTRPEKLAITGASNGGLLVGACMTQRPDLFGACLPSVGVMDMLRFHKFTIGWAWVPEYGTADAAGDFPFLRAYSPLHNLRAGTRYPATLITTADHDDRVVPAHSFKFAAALQAAQSGDAPCLIRIETRAGHGAGVPMSKLIEEHADKLAFLKRVLF